MQSLKKALTQYGVAVRRDWWARMERNRTDRGLPDGAFDFVSIHPSRFIGGFSLCSPMCIIDPVTCTRPTWESWHFDSIVDAIRAAKWICGSAWRSGYKLSIVWCPDDND